MITSPNKTASSTQRLFWKAVSIFTVLTLAALLVSGVFIFLRTAYTDADFTLFEDGFESDDFSSWDSADSKWSISGGDIHSGDKRAEVKGNTDGEYAYLLVSVSTESYGDIVLRYWLKVHSGESGLEVDDIFTVEVSSDGGSNWDVINTLSDVPSGDWTEYEHFLDGDTFDNSAFQFRFGGNLDAGADKIYLDDVVLTGKAPEGLISGYKWYDANGNGSPDPDEPPLANWGIVMINGEDTDYAYTDPTGYYEFRELYGGTYTICEELPMGGWTQSYPDDATENATECGGENLGHGPWGYDVTIGSDGEAMNRDFGNTIGLTPIHAFKFNDLDESGRRDEGEPLLPGWEICLNPSGFDDEHMWNWWYDVFYNEDEACQVTDGTGEASWNVPPGQYWMSEQMNNDQSNEGWQQTTPSPYSGGYDVEVNDEGVSYRAYDEEQGNYYFVNVAEFGNWLWTGEARAFKYNDVNHNGEYEPWDNDEPIEGWEICLSRYFYSEDEDNGDYEPVSCLETDSNGEVLWTGLSQGDYLLEESEEPGWFPTRDRQEYFSLWPWDGENGDFEFGNWFLGESAQIHAAKFYDLNRDGIWDEGEMPLAGWEICVEPDWDFFNEEFDGDFWWLFDNFEQCWQTDESGWARWTNVPPGAYSLRESLWNDDWTWEATTQENSEDTDVSVPPLGPGEEFIYEFGNWIEPGEINAYKLLWPDLFPDEERWYSWGDQDLFWWGEGDLSWGDADPRGILPSLSGWELCLSRSVNWWDSGGQWLPLGCEETDGRGSVSWTDLPPGSYRVEEESRPWWRSVGSSFQNLWLDAGGVVGGIGDIIGGFHDSNTLFLNWNEDPVPPESHFDDPLDHEIIETEIVSLSLTGGSQDNLSGVASAELSVWPAGDPDFDLLRWPAGDPDFDTFRPGDPDFDLLFSKIDCSSNELTIETEIVSMDLVSVVDPPVTVSWSHDWTPSSPGIYCFRVRASDNNGNVENGVFAGPVAYILAPQEPQEPQTGTITGYKFNDLDGDGVWYPPNGVTNEPGIEGWTVALGRVGEPEGDGPIPIEIVAMDLTGGDGRFDISGIEPGNYKLFEESRGGWTSTNPPLRVDSFFDITYNIDLAGHVPPLVTDSFFDVFVELDGTTSISTSNQSVLVPQFGNRQPEPELPPVTDTASPSSTFDDTLDHEIINTEMLSLELSGVSTDDMSGVSRVRLYEHQINNADTYPSQSSFFDVFYELSCPVSPDSFFDVFTEINTKSLDGGQNENWSFGWTPIQGTFCFAAVAEDNEGNVERTAYAGPVAYIPPSLAPHISQEATENTPTLINNLAEFIVSWVTDHIATSRVIYDTISHSVLGDPPDYGYAFSTVEDPALVINHEVVVSGLSPGTTYYYRSVSHGSPESVGGEQSTSTTSLPPIGIFSYPFFSPSPTSEGENPENPTPESNEPESSSSSELTEESFVSEVSGEEENPPLNQVAFAPETGEESEVTGGATTQEPSLSVSSSEGSTEEENPAPQETGEDVTGMDNNTAGPNRFLAAVVSALTPLQWVFVAGVLGAGALIGSYVYRIGRKPRVKGSRKV